MQHGVVLDIGVVADHNAVDVAAQDRVVPDAGAIAQRDVARHHRAAGDVNIFAQRRFLAQELVELA